MRHIIGLDQILWALFKSGQNLHSSKKDLHSSHLCESSVLDEYEPWQVISNNVAF